MGSSASKVVKENNNDLKEEREAPTILVIERPLEIIKDDGESNIVNIEVENLEEKSLDLDKDNYLENESSIESVTPMASPISRSFSNKGKKFACGDLTNKMQCQEDFNAHCLLETTPDNWKSPTDYAKCSTSFTRIPRRPVYQNAKSRHKTLCDKYPNIYAKSIESIIPALEGRERDCKPLHDMKHCFDEVRQRAQTQERNINLNDKNYKQTNNNDFQQLKDGRKGMEKMVCNNMNNNWKTTRMGDNAWIHYPSEQTDLSSISKNYKSQKNSSAVVKRPVQLPNTPSTDSASVCESFGSGYKYTCSTSRPRTQRNISKRGYMDVLFRRDNTNCLHETTKKTQPNHRKPLSPPIEEYDREKYYNGIYETKRRSKNGSHNQILNKGSSQSPLSINSKTSEISLSKIKRDDCLDAISRLAISEINCPWNIYNSSYRESRSDGESNLHRRKS